MKTAKINISFQQHNFVAHSVDRATSRILEDAGWRFSSSEEVWYTPSFAVAARLREHMDDNTLSILNKVMLSITPWTKPLPHPDHLKPMIYQTIAAKFALARNRSYLAMAPGTGKTPTAALIINALHHQSTHKFIYICPPFLARDVEDKIDTWSPHVGVEHFKEPRLFGNLLILPSTMLGHKDTLAAIKYFRKGHPLVGIVDEAQYFKSDESDRTRFLFGHKEKQGLVSLFDRTIYLSGTPMPNRPLELYPVLSAAAPETIDFMTRDQFGLKYCAGRYDGYGYDFSGASNLRDLAAKVVGTFMFRLKKSELPLPPVTEEVVIVGDDMKSELVKFEQQLLRDYDVEDLMKDQIEKQYKAQDMHLMTYQRLLGLHKVPHAITLLDHMLEESDESVLVFAKHKEVVQALYQKAFEKGYFPVVITGDVPSEKRYDLVKQFQSNPKRRVMIGNLKAMGVGFDITKATRVLNVEPDWTPATNDQGRDRAHRYGQTKPVFVQYLCFANSVDKRVLDVILKKRKLGTYL